MAMGHTIVATCRGRRPRVASRWPASRQTVDHTAELIYDSLQCSRRPSGLEGNTQRFFAIPAFIEPLPRDRHPECAGPGRSSREPLSRSGVGGSPMG